MTPNDLIPWARLMAGWAAYCESPPAAAKGSVAPLRA
jgi:hypothetical protein